MIKLFSRSAATSVAFRFGHDPSAFAVPVPYGTMGEPILKFTRMPAGVPQNQASPKPITLAARNWCVPSRDEGRRSLISQGRTRPWAGHVCPPWGHHRPCLPPPVSTARRHIFPIGHIETYLSPRRVPKAKFRQRQRAST